MTGVDAMLDKSDQNVCVRRLLAVAGNSTDGQGFDRRQLLAIPALIAAGVLLQRPAWGAATGMIRSCVNKLVDCCRLDASPVPIPCLSELKAALATLQAVSLVTSTAWR